MKRILKLGLILSFALVAQNQFWQNFSFTHGTETIIKVALILALFEIFLKPIIKILLLPINLLTLGFFRLIINTFSLYLAVFLIADLSINNINLPSQTIYWFSLPQIKFDGFFVYLINSISINLLAGIFKYILKSSKKIKK